MTSPELVDLVTGAGFAEVSTFLASGNVIFRPSGDGPDVDGAGIAAALTDGLGYTVPTTVRTGPEVSALADAEPFTEAELSASTGKPQMILLFDEPPADGLRAVEGLSEADNRLVIGDGVIHWLPIGGMSESELEPDHIASLVGTVTVRTANTLRRLVPKLGG